MAADLNRVTLVGRLTRDPELRHTAGGHPIASLRLAVTSRGRDASGNWEDRPNFFDVTVFGRQAESASTYLGKGRRVGIDGRLEWQEWEDKNGGGKRQAVKVIASDVFFLDSRDAGGGSGQQPGGYGSDLPAEQPAYAGAPADDDDIPF